MRRACEACGGSGWLWEELGDPRCIHAVSRGVCAACARFLERILPIVKQASDQKPQQQDIALSLGYTARHLRRLCTNLGCRDWASFWVAARSGAFSEQTRQPSNVIELPQRKPA